MNLGDLERCPDLAAEVRDRLVVQAWERRRRDGARLPAGMVDLLDALDRIAAGEAERTCDPASDQSETPMLMVSVREAAERLRCKPQWVRHLLGTGRLDGHRTGGIWLVSVASLDRYRYGREPAA